MIVYVVRENDFILAVFSDRQQAEIFQERMDRKYNYGRNPCIRFSVNSWQLDCPTVWEEYGVADPV